MSPGADKKFSITLSPFWPLAENWLIGSDKSERCKWHECSPNPRGGHCLLHIREPLLLVPAFVQSTQLCLGHVSQISVKRQSRNCRHHLLKKKKRKKTQEAEIYSLAKMVMSSWFCLHSTLQMPSPWEQCSPHLEQALPPKCICSEAFTAFYGENHVIEVLQRRAHCRDRITEASGTTSYDESDARPLASEPCHPC